MSISEAGLFEIMYGMVDMLKHHNEIEKDLRRKSDR